MPTRPFFRPPLQPDRDAIARRNKMLADTHERIRQTTQASKRCVNSFIGLSWSYGDGSEPLRRMAKIRPPPARRVRGP